MPREEDAPSTSYGDANCTDFGVSQKVDAYEAFIESTTGRSVEAVQGGGSTSPGPQQGSGSGSGSSSGGSVTETYAGSTGRRTSASKPTA